MNQANLFATMLLLLPFSAAAENSGQVQNWQVDFFDNEPPVQEPDENVSWPMTGSGEIDIFEHHGNSGENHYVARMIKNLGHCGGGDWQSMMQVIDANLDEYHEYSVEWQNGDLAN